METDIESSEYGSAPSFFSEWMPHNGENLSIQEGRRWACLHCGNVGAIALFCAGSEIPFFLPLLRETPYKLVPLWLDYIFCQPTPSQETTLENSTRVHRVLIPFDQGNLLAYLKTYSPINRLSPKESYIGNTVKVVVGDFRGVTAKVEKVLGAEGMLILSIQMLGKRIQFRKKMKEVRFQDNTHLDQLIIVPEERKQPERIKKDDSLNIQVSEINQELIKYLARHPNLMYELSPRKFETLVAEILADMGFDVQLTPETKDGGRDILAVLKIPIGEILTIVECKRYDPDNKIGIDIVERFLWTLDRKDQASCGLIATTSFFTSGARDREKEFKWRLILKDFLSMKEWTSNYGCWKMRETSGLWIPRTLY